MTKKKTYDKGGVVYYQKKGLMKSVILHLSAETHKKLKYLAWHKETSLQKLSVKAIEDLVRDVNPPEKGKIS